LIPSCCGRSALLVFATDAAASTCHSSCNMNLCAWKTNQTLTILITYSTAMETKRRLVSRHCKCTYLQPVNRYFCFCHLWNSLREKHSHGLSQNLVIRDQHKNLQYKRNKTLMYQNNAGSKLH
jgi:hypothetical protein